MNNLILITLTAAVGFGGLSQAATFTSSSKITTAAGYTGPTIQDKSVSLPLDAFDMVNGKTTKAVTSEYLLKDQTTGPIHDAGQGGYNFLNSYTVNLSNLYNSTALDSQVLLNSFSFISRWDTTVTSDLKMKVYDSAGTLLGTSGVVSYDANANTNGVYGTGTFTFSDEITLDSSSDYTFKLENSKTGNLLTNSDKIGMGVFNMYWSSGVNGGYQIDGHHNYDAPVVRITTSSLPIPEPAAASLSLLGLAALAARRRRA